MDVLSGGELLHDEHDLATSVMRHMAELRVIAYRYCDWRAVEGRTHLPLALSVHGVVRDLKRKRSDRSERVTSMSTENPVKPTTVSEHVTNGKSHEPGSQRRGHGFIVGIIRDGERFYARNRPIAKYVLKEYGVNIYTSGTNVVIRPRNVPSDLVPLAVENDIWCLALGDPDVYAKNRNFPLQPVLRHTTDIMRSIRGMPVPDALVELRDVVLPSARKSGILAKIARQMEDSMFTCPRKNRALTSEERALFESLRVGASDTDGLNFRKGGVGEDGVGEDGVGEGGDGEGGDGEEVECGGGDGEEVEDEGGEEDEGDADGSRY